MDHKHLAKSLAIRRRRSQRRGRLCTFFIRKIPFRRLVRDMCPHKADGRIGCRWKEDAVDLLQCAAEDFCVDSFRLANHFASKSKMVTVTDVHFRAASCLNSLSTNKETKLGE